MEPTSSNKLYYKIGEACKALDIQPYVLRYWETEFAVLSPSKSKSGQRVYTEKELGIIRRIKELLYDEGYTIAGAKKKLESELAMGASFPAVAPEAEEEVEAEPEPDANLALPLDTPRRQQIETRRKRIEKALAEARSIQALLEGRTKKR
ncbi:MAG: MerR family transcriptional regulator [Acidobacteriota bacterium]